MPKLSEIARVTAPRNHDDQDETSTQAWLVFSWVRHRIGPGTNARVIHNGANGWRWEGAVSWAIADLWPELASLDEDLRSQYTAPIYAFLRDTGNALCQDPRSKPPVWWIRDNWRDVAVVQRFNRITATPAELRVSPEEAGETRSPEPVEVTVTPTKEPYDRVTEMRRVQAVSVARTQQRMDSDVLDALIAAGGGPTTVAKLAKASGHYPGPVMKSVERLVEAGLVTLTGERPRIVTATGQVSASIEPVTDAEIPAPPQDVSRATRGALNHLIHYVSQRKRPVLAADAARRLHISSSALSKALQLAEAEGSLTVDRSVPRKTRLSAPGAATALPARTPPVSPSGKPRPAYAHQQSVRETGAKVLEELRRIGKPILLEDLSRAVFPGRDVKNARAETARATKVLEWEGLITRKHVRGTPSRCLTITLVQPGAAAVTPAPRPEPAQEPRQPLPQPAVRAEPAQSVSDELSALIARLVDERVRGIAGAAAGSAEENQRLRIENAQLQKQLDQIRGALGG